MPKISVVMPVYNGEKYLDEAIDSILNQTFSDFEFIIINDCSKDGTENIIKSYNDDRIVYVKNDANLGVAKSLNKGLDIASGEYIARMDADDISIPKRFKKQLRYMETHKNVAVCGSSIIFFGAVKAKKVGAPCGKEKAKLDLLLKSGLFHPTVMMRRSVIEKEHYRYSAEFDKAEDFELWTRIALKYDISNLDKPLLKYRVHKNQVTQNYIDRYKQLRLVARQNFLVSIGVFLSDTENRAFNDYCLEEFNYDKQTPDLISALKKIVQMNGQSKFFDESLIEKRFSKIVLNIAKAQEIYSKKELIELSGFVRAMEIQKDAIKCFIKHIVKRK